MPTKKSGARRSHPLWRAGCEDRRQAQKGRERRDEEEESELQGSPFEEHREGKDVRCLLGR